jgi:hypothetical protein
MKKNIPVRARSPHGYPEVSHCSFSIPEYELRPGQQSRLKNELLHAPPEKRISVGFVMNKKKAANCGKM